MGVIAITIQLVDATPYALRYLLTNEGEGANVILSNSGIGPSPDLRFDAITAAARSTGDGAPLLQMLAQPVANQAQARHLLMGEQVGNTLPELANIRRCHARITPRTGLLAWTVDAGLGIGPSAGFAVLGIACQGIAGDAYLDVRLAHTRHDRW